MEQEYAIEVSHMSKKFKVYLDRGFTMKELLLFKKRRRYEERQVLKDISFSIRKGEAVGLIGHNGCGKSTTLKLLTRIMYPNSGKVVSRGRVSSLIELGAGFHPDMSGRENIYINASIFGLTKREIDARLDDIITFSELEDYIDNPVRTYSSGMYMRLAFSVAINVDAEILLIDEILAVGDANFQTKCYERLMDLKANGVTIVIVTHDMGATRRICDRAIWIHDGLVAADGKTNAVVDEYLAYMSGERKSRHNKEAENDQDDGFSGQRYGNGKVKIVSVDMINSNGETTDFLMAEEPFSLEYHYKVNEPVDEMIVGMGIFTRDGKWIFGTNTSMCGTRVKIDKPEGIVTMECEPLHLLTGDYTLQVSVIGMDSTPFDYIQEYKVFHVDSTKNAAGIMFYNVKWKA